MKTIIRFLLVGTLLTSVTTAFASVKAATPLPASQTKLESAPTIVSHRTALSATDLAKYQQRELATKAKTQKQAAGEGMDTSTMVIIGVVVVVVIVAVAAGGGGGGGGY